MQENNTVTNKKSGKMWGIIGAIVVIAIAAGVYVGTRPGSQTVVTNPVTTPIDTTGTPVQTPPVTTPPKPTPVSSTYKDGTYSAQGNYYSPGGAEVIGVQVTLQNDIITAATVTANNPSGPQAARFQSMFISGYKSYVIGKDISSLSLSRVSGSSLTPQGFDDAVAKIKTEAKA